MSKVGQSFLRGAQQALAYAKGQKCGTKIHKIKIPKQVDAKAVKVALNFSRHHEVENNE